MKRINFLVVVAALAVIAFADNAQAQAVPSLVTQQMRLSTGGATPNYVQLRGITGALPSTDYYQLDQAPVPSAGVNYSMWLNDQNQIVRSQGFGNAQAHYLLQVNATGNQLQWVDPSTLTTLNGDIIGPVDSTLVNVGYSGLNNRLIDGINNANGYVPGTFISIDRGGTDSNAVPTAGAVAFGTGTAYNFTGVGTAGQLLISQGNGAPTWSSIGNIIVARNGLTQNADTIEWGGNLLHATTINQAGFDMNFIGSSGTPNFNVGDGASTFNINMNPGAAGNITLLNIPVDSTAPSILALDASGHVRTRSLNSLVTADNGLIVTGNNNVELGAPATGGAPLLVDRFVSLNAHALNIEGSGSMNIGLAGGNADLNVNTGTTGVMTVQGSTLNSTTNFNNIAYVDTATNVVHRAQTSAMTRDDAPSLYLAMDASGNIVKSISPTSGVTRGQIAGTGAFTYTSPAVNIAAGASITVSVENHSGVSGTVLVQVTNVTPGASGTFSVETSESIQAGSFINYVVMN